MDVIIPISVLEFALKYAKEALPNDLLTIHAVDPHNRFLHYEFVYEEGDKYLKIKLMKNFRPNRV